MNRLSITVLIVIRFIEINIKLQEGYNNNTKHLLIKLMEIIEILISIFSNNKIDNLHLIMLSFLLLFKGFNIFYYY